MRNDKSICNKCSNVPCKNNETISPNSGFLVSAQFKIEFKWDENNKIFISECSGFNKKDFTYFPEDYEVVK